MHFDTTENDTEQDTRYDTTENDTEQDTQYELNLIMQLVAMLILLTASHLRRLHEHEEYQQNLDVVDGRILDVSISYHTCMVSVICKQAVDYLGFVGFTWLTTRSQNAANEIGAPRRLCAPTDTETGLTSSVKPSRTIGDNPGDTSPWYL